MASVRKTKLSPYWQAVLTLASGARTNRSTKQTDKNKAIDVANEMQRTIDATCNGTLTRERLLRTFNDLMSRLAENRLSDIALHSKGSQRSTKSEKALLTELRRRLGRNKTSE